MATEEEEEEEEEDEDEEDEEAKTTNQEGPNTAHEAPKTAQYSPYSSNNMSTLCCSILLPHRRKHNIPCAARGGPQEEAIKKPREKAPKRKPTRQTSPRGLRPHPLPHKEASKLRNRREAPEQHPARSRRTSTKRPLTHNPGTVAGWAGRKQLEDSGGC